MVMRRGRPKVSTTYCESVPMTSMRFDLGLAVGFDAQLDGHAEEVEVLRDLPDGAEALVVAEPVDGVLVGEVGGAGAVEPLGEEGLEFGAVVLFGLLLKLLAGGALAGVGDGKHADGVVEELVANNPAQHPEDHCTFVRREALKLGREGVELADAGERDGIVGQRADRHVLDLFVVGCAAGSFLDIAACA